MPLAPDTAGLTVCGVTAARSSSLHSAFFFSFHCRSSLTRFRAPSIFYATACRNCGKLMMGTMSKFILRPFVDSSWPSEEEVQNCNAYWQQPDHLSVVVVECRSLRAGTMYEHSACGCERDFQAPILTTTKWMGVGLQ